MAYFPKTYLGSTKINKSYLGTTLVQDTLFEKWIDEAYTYYDITDTRSYYSGSSTLVDLSSTKLNASIINAQGDNLEYSVSGSIPQVRNNAGINYATNLNIAGTNYSSTGITHNIWVKPNDDNFPYEQKTIFQIRAAQSGNYWGVYMIKNGTSGGWFYNVRLVNATSDASPQTETYTLPNAGFLDDYHLFSYVWDSGNSITMYFDGVQVLTSSTTKAWVGDTGMGSGGVNLFSASTQISGESFSGYWGEMSIFREKWNSDRMLEYYNETKTKFGR